MWRVLRPFGQQLMFGLSVIGHGTLGARHASSRHLIGWRPVLAAAAASAVALGSLILFTSHTQPEAATVQHSPTLTENPGLAVTNPQQAGFEFGHAAGLVRHTLIRLTDNPAGAEVLGWVPGNAHMAAQIAVTSPGLAADATISSYLLNPVTQQVYRLSPNQGPMDTTVTWSTDGSVVAYVQNGTVRVWHREGRDVVVAAPGQGQSYQEAWISPDGARLLATMQDARHNLHLMIGPASGPLRATTAPASATIPGLPAWSPTSRQVVVALFTPPRTQAYWMVDGQTGHARVLAQVNAQDTGGRMEAARWLGGEAAVILPYATSAAALPMVAVPGGQVSDLAKLMTTGGADQLLWYEVAPDGRTIAYGATSGVGLYAVATGGKHVIGLSSQGLVHAWSPDGTRLLYPGPLATTGGTVDPLATPPLWVYDTTTNRAWQQLGSQDWSGFAASFSPDGRHIAYMTGGWDNSQLRTMPVGEHQQGLALTPPFKGMAAQWNWSPDGRFIAFAASGNAVAPQLYEVATK